MRERHHATELRWRGFYWNKVNGKGGQEKGETSLWRQNSRREETGRQRSRKKRERSECAPEVLLVAAAETVSCQDLKGRPVRMPEY